MSMLNTLAHKNVDVPVYFIHGTQNSATHALDDEVRQIEIENPNVRVHVVYSDPFGSNGDVRRCDRVGLIGVPLLESLLPGLDAEFYICGPKPFMAGLYHGLMDSGVSDTRIHFEFFGPKQELTRSADERVALPVAALAS
jgi:nitric oxide dioxygenase